MRFCLIILLLLSASIQPRWVVAAEEGHGHGDHVHIGVAPEDEAAELVDLEAGLDPRADLAVYTFIVFILLLVILTSTAFRPISKALAEREDRIRNNIEEAKVEREKAEQLRKDYEGQLEAADDRVREIFAEANAKAEALRAEKLAEADREAESRKQKALEEIERAKDQAVQELFDAMSARVADATEHVLGRSLSDEDQSRLINDALAQFSTKR
ncbi:F0F1 ATP synthase subunit B family protein [Thalassoroseus pseudoceratinae]|uniref:F0F1 ATP synthase subunit B family protein n=1 Tax=Thalassoroseus pseudoceratinae TaxID=2713176 RepID=UPI00141F6CCA|nr:ATP synthase F0 subunit B [Thalassoroseus pseudoceratinae]